ncbi:terpene synthase family protein [Kallotenue papyrolyticum]|uniref:terpene synthase family protein n=1 Tax=Kallotenue papyrolyticum TaxID=1325125 RepID=UPI0004B72849|nr:hypothetical protein [Kallotenue papyrolyticum]
MEYARPSLTCPFPVAHHPAAAEVEQAALAWARRHGLLASAGVERRVRAVRIGELMGMVYPHLAPDALLLLTQWTLWGFVWDDLCGTPPLGNDPQRLDAAQQRLLAVLRGAALHPDEAPTVRALADLRQRWLRYATPVQLDPYIRSVEQHFAACLWEATNRSAGRTPDLQAYLAMRPFSSGVYTYTEAFGLLEGLPWPEELRRDPQVERLTLLANNVVCWINDLLSLPKELASGEQHNLVVILQQHQGLSLSSALAQVEARYYQDLAAYQALEACLPRCGGELDRALATYTQVLRGWMAGSLQWSYASGRYGASMLQAQPA